MLCKLQRSAREDKLLAKPRSRWEGSNGTRGDLGGAATLKGSRGLWARVRSLQDTGPVVWGQGLK